MSAAYFYEEEEGWVRIKDLKRDRPLALFLDFDGTLAPIRSTPSAAAITRECRDILKDLAALPGVFLSICSGRALEDLKNKMGLDEICYIANHGYNIFSRQFQWVHPQACAFSKKISSLRETLSRVLNEFQGVMIEDKGLTLSIHYRLLKSGKFTELKEAVTKVMRNLSGLKMAGGKKVIDIRPDMDWDKGKAVKAVLANLCPKQDHLVMYIGDDLTDEDAFKQLKGSGITIKVGKGPTCADFFMKSTHEVTRFLEEVNLFF